MTTRRTTTAGSRRSADRHSRGSILVGCAFPLAVTIRPLDTRRYEIGALAVFPGLLLVMDETRLSV